jgi:UDP-N-acetylmuramate dehydrogenase
MSRHTTWRVGGPADLFLVPADRDDLLAALRLLAAAGFPWLVVGAGSNLLVRDGGIRGAVIQTGGLRRLAFDGTAVRAEGGVPMMTLIASCAERGLSGIERLAGIPGTVGGAVMMNAGAGGQQLGDVVAEAVLVGAAGEERWSAERLGFVYRRSAVPADRVVVETELQLRESGPEELQAAMRRRLQERRGAQGVGGPNAGSVFKNPPGEAAWRLIDAAGLRGTVEGGAQVAERHANFIVNRGGARAADILALIERVRETVRRTSGVELEPEVRIVGEN